MPKIGLKDALGKGLGAAGKVFTLLDTVAMVDKVSKNTAPILEKAIDRHHERQEGLVTLPDVTHLDLTPAKAHLEELGFLVAMIPAKTSQVKKDHKLDEVVAMVPKPGKLTRGSLIKLYYVTEDNLPKSQTALELAQLKGLDVGLATQLLNEDGFRVVALPIAPNKTYAKGRPQTVVQTEPKAKPQPGGLVKVFYLTEEVIAASQAMVDQQAALQEELKKSLDQAVGTAQKAASDLAKNVKDFFYPHKEQ